jgi:hypothetical protein
MAGSKESGKINKKLLRQPFFLYQSTKVFVELFLASVELILQF